MNPVVLTEAEQQNTEQNTYTFGMAVLLKCYNLCETYKVINKAPHIHTNSTSQKFGHVFSINSMRKCVKAFDRYCKSYIIRSQINQGRQLSQTTTQKN